MEISSTNSSIYSAVSISQTVNNIETNNSSFDSILNNQSTTSQSTKKETFRVVAFIDKYNGFSSLSPTDEKIFREILSDDKLTMAEMKSLTYEQVQKIDKFLIPSFTNASPNEVPIVKNVDFKMQGMLQATKMTDDEDFNRALFETVQTIDDPIEMGYFFHRLSGNLGWNDKTCFIRERDIPELRKDSTNEDWKILDYKKFIKANIKEYEDLIKNPITSDEDRKLFQKLLKDFILLEKNHNKIKEKYLS